MLSFRFSPTISMMPYSATKLAVSVLGSSSSGNATLVWNGKSAILVDCGFGPGYLEKSLRTKGFRIEDLAGVLITHVHRDHVNEWCVRKLIKVRIPIYCPLGIELHLQVQYDTLARASHLGLLKAIDKSELDLAGFQVRPFEVPHDSPGGCFGYNISSETDGRTKKVTVSTDIANPTNVAARCIADSDVVVIESNHDLDMLENSGRPLWLKRRIREFGHLSNDQCASTLLCAFDHSTRLPQAIMLAHVSQECNTNQIAVACTSEALNRQGIDGISVVETFPHRVGRTVSV